MAEDAFKTVESRVQELVRLLSDKNPALRNNAFDALVNIGEKAVPILEKAKASENSDVSIRIGMILNEIKAPIEARKLVGGHEGLAPQGRNGSNFPVKK